MGVVRVVPVQQGVVQPHLESLGPGSGQEVGHHVPAQGGVGGLEVGILAVEQAEAVVVLGGEDDILHPCPSGGFDPLCRVVVRGGELPEIGQVVLLRHLLGAAHPLPPGGDGVQPPVDEHAEPGPAEPGHAGLVVPAVKLIHAPALLCGLYSTIWGRALQRGVPGDRLFGDDKGKKEGKPHGRGAGEPTFPWA